GTRALPGRSPQHEGGPSRPALNLRPNTRTTFHKGILKEPGDTHANTGRRVHFAEKAICQSHLTYLGPRIKQRHIRRMMFRYDVLFLLGIIFLFFTFEPAPVLALKPGLAKIPAKPTGPVPPAKPGRSVCTNYTQSLKSCADESVRASRTLLHRGTDT
ncbi:hypothetical protein MTO96_039043, partial [Rhipicephalus appendiculatus]